MNSRIVVGVNGSRASLTALRWAAGEASRRRAQLSVVWAWHPEQFAPYAGPAGHPDVAQLQGDAERGLAAAQRLAFGPHTPAGLSREVAEGLAERILVDRSAGADMLVLGSTSVPAVVGRSIGPVIRSCLSRAHCPVVVIGPEGAESHDDLGTETLGSTLVAAGLGGRDQGHQPYSPGTSPGSSRPRGRRRPVTARALLAQIPAPRRGE